MERTQLASWLKLQQLAQGRKHLQLAKMFAEDGQRFEKHSLMANGLLVDYSKNLIDEEVQAALLALARDCEVEQWRDAMFAGQPINKTENRAVLHTALRSELAGDENLQQQIKQQLSEVEQFATAVRAGQQCGYSGKPFTDVVCIGVGGSNLGPEMATQALADMQPQPQQLHYISSIDAMPLLNLLSQLNPETTLFIVSSKTFTTAETLLNANTVKQWLLKTAPAEAIAKHFVAVTMAVTLAGEFGIEPQYCFKIWDWVGGRFSLWSAIGLPIAISRGFAEFQRLLDGAAMMDKHFATAPLQQNMPVMLALVGIWNSTFLGMDTLAILPYDQTLHRLPAYLQQAEMESNGKAVNWQGQTVSYSTCPVVWGQTGINGQHAFYQLLHQGTQVVAADLIVSINNRAGVEGSEHHQQLLANCFAQSQALMNGVSEKQVMDVLQAGGLSPEQAKALAPHKVHVGNRPATTILLDTLDAYHLGALIALYEHKIFVQGIIWQIYSFDQWGVELGKQLATKLQPDLQTDQPIHHYESSTNGLINYYKNKSN